jgi:hypothetical protein
MKYSVSLQICLFGAASNGPEVIVNNQAIAATKLVGVQEISYGPLEISSFPVKSCQPASGASDCFLVTSTS